MPCTNQDLRQYIEMFFEAESHRHEDGHQVEYRKGRALEAFDALVRDADAWRMVGDNRASEADLVARVHALEERAAAAADLATKAMKLLTKAREGDED